MGDLGGIGSEAAALRRVVKRYSNRKLYDTKDSRYVTLLQIAEMIRSGEDVQIIDNSSKEDKTDVTLALIISEELRTQPRAIPLTTLRSLIRDRGERLLTHLRSRPIGQILGEPAGGGEGDEATDSPSQPDVSPAEGASEGRPPPGSERASSLDELASAVQRLSDRLDRLEDRLAQRDRPKG